MKDAWFWLGAAALFLWWQHNQATEDAARRALLDQEFNDTSARIDAIWHPPQ